MLVLVKAPQLKKQIMRFFKIDMRSIRHRINSFLFFSARRLALRQPETVSVCSCTCYPGIGSSSHTSGKDRKWVQSKSGTSEPSWWQKIWRKWSNFGHFHSRKKHDSDHIFDAETMSISNAKKNAIKRNSL